MASSPPLADSSAKQNDYSSWSNAELVQRVTALEAQLRAQNNQRQQQHQASHQVPASPSSTAKAAAATAAPAMKKAKKPAKPFDPSRYHTRVIALKFAYLGAGYNGFEHHANNRTPLPTIEEELWRALRKTRLIFPLSRAGGQQQQQQQNKRSESEAGRQTKAEQEEVCWDGVEYSKCGRTDRGVSAFGQVVGLRVRSARPKMAGRSGDGSEAVQTQEEQRRRRMENADDGIVDPAGKKEAEQQGEDSTVEQEAEQKTFDHIRDELPYIQLLNRVLPPDIRVLAWCPEPPAGFSARFSCRERRYRYFFTNPAYVPLPGDRGQESGKAAGAAGGAWLDIGAMRRAAAKYEGLHDFRNFCKVDASKQISNFERRIFHAGIHEANLSDGGSGRSSPAGPTDQQGRASVAPPKLYYFEVRGSAFLWHQVRHLVAILFLVGQGYEQPDIVDELLDTVKTPSKPLYDMASDTPLVLWDCIFPAVNEPGEGADHGAADVPAVAGYQDALRWVHVGDEAGGRFQSKRQTTGVEDGKYGRNGVMEELWALWRQHKMHEVLAWQLMDVVHGQGHAVPPAGLAHGALPDDASDRVFDGGELPRTIGKYVPVMQRERMESPEVVNARYAARKGLDGHTKADASGDDMDE